jgi:hypothetical protein
MGHVFFAFVSGDENVLITKSPFTTHAIVPSDVINATFFYMGGVIFTFFLSIFLILLTYLISSKFNVKHRVSFGFGNGTIGFHLISLILIYYFFELLANVVPVEINGIKSDFAKLLFYSFNINFVISDVNNPLLIFLYFLVTTLTYAFVFIFYVISVSNLVFCLISFISKRFSLDERQN